MSNWQKPSFEELAMNAEIGGYQPDEWDGERYDVPFVQSTKGVGAEVRASYSVPSAALRATPAASV